MLGDVSCVSSSRLSMAAQMYQFPWPQIPLLSQEKWDTQYELSNIEGSATVSHPPSWTCPAYLHREACQDASLCRSTCLYHLHWFPFWRGTSVQTPYFIPFQHGLRHLATVKLSVTWSTFVDEWLQHMPSNCSIASVNLAGDLSPVVPPSLLPCPLSASLLTLSIKAKMPKNTLKKLSVT